MIGRSVLGRRAFKVTYVVLAVMSILAVLLPIAGAVNNLGEDSSTEVSFWSTYSLVFFLTYALFGWPVFVMFLMMNFWIARVRQPRRVLYLILSGVLLILNGVMIRPTLDWYSNGMPMP